MAELLPFLAILWVVISVLEKKVKAGKKKMPRNPWDAVNAPRPGATQTPAAAVSSSKSGAAAPPSGAAQPAERAVPSAAAAQPSPAFVFSAARSLNEGEDPCHPEPSAPFSPVTPPETDAAEQDALNRELVRGVVLGEILRRPERRRGRRPA